MAFAADDCPLPMVGSPQVVTFDERRSTMDNYGRTSRRGFVALGVTIVGSLVVPSSAYGKSNGLGTVEVPGSETAREKWAIALKKAEQEGSPVISAYTSSGGEAMPSDVLTASASKYVYFLVGVPVQVIASANYTTSAENRIIRFNWTQLRSTAVRATNVRYNAAIIDSGRTLAISYNCEFVDPVLGIPVGVGDFYAEFYANRTGTLS